MDAPQVVDVSGFLDHLANHPDTPIPDLVKDACRQIVESFHHTGVLIIRDPRVNEQANWTFIDMMEQYYQRAGQQLYNGEQVAEVHPELHFQIGATPEYIERARDHCTRMNGLPEDSKAVSLCPPQFDAKWRYFWRIGDFANSRGNYEFDNIVPSDFPH